MLAAAEAHIDGGDAADAHRFAEAVENVVDGKCSFGEEFLE